MAVRCLSPSPQSLNRLLILGSSSRRSWLHARMTNWRLDRTTSIAAPIARNRLMISAPLPLPRGSPLVWLPSDYQRIHGESSMTARNVDDGRTTPRSWDLGCSGILHGFQDFNDAKRPGTRTVRELGAASLKPIMTSTFGANSRSRSWWLARQRNGSKGPSAAVTSAHPRMRYAIRIEQPCALSLAARDRQESA